MLNTATVRTDTDSAADETDNPRPTRLGAGLDAGAVTLVVWLAAVLAMAWALTHLSGGIGPAGYVQDLV
jgi:hypothetical protein